MRVVGRIMRLVIAGHVFFSIDQMAELLSETMSQYQNVNFFLSMFDYIFANFPVNAPNFY